MNLIDCNTLSVLPERLYGGRTGPKISVVYDGSVWMLKSQQILKNRTDMKNIEISYANDPISEYIGSHIYNIIGIKAHDTLLGAYKGKVCVLCRDAVYPGKLYEFREFRNVLFDEGIIQSTDGMSTLISDIMQVIDLTDLIDTDISKQRFWDQFVIDSLIGNTDRNNGNWGYVYSDGRFTLYDVYDCGGCLNNKRSDDQMQKDIDTGRINTMALNYTFNYEETEGSRVNPFHYIERNCNSYIVKALAMVAGLDFSKVVELVESVKPLISDIRAEFYETIMRIRYNKLIELHRAKSPGTTDFEKFLNAGGLM